MALWLVGSGGMAQAYSEVLLALGRQHAVIGRGAASAAAFERATGVSVQVGGLAAALARGGAPETAIVAVGVEDLYRSALSLIQAGTKRILLEKPGGIDVRQIADLGAAARAAGSSVFLAYNRRFYGSVRRAREIIEEDGGLLSAQFEFSEWGHRLAVLDKDPRVLRAWLLANSSHVIDLAFFLCGFPSEYRVWRSGTLSWHPSGARFFGAGVTQRSVPFSFIADWEAPGRWGVELMTKRNRLILRPLEQLQRIPLGSIEPSTVELDPDWDGAFKPGVRRQVEAFLSNSCDDLCSLDEQVRNAQLYAEIAGYPCET